DWLNAAIAYDDPFDSDQWKQRGSCFNSPADFVLHSVHPTAGDCMRPSRRAVIKAMGAAGGLAGLDTQEQYQEYAVECLRLAQRVMVLILIGSCLICEVTSR